MSREIKEKPECDGCLYSEYDTDGKNVIFLGCFKHSKCTGAIKPKRKFWHIEHKGHEYYIEQHQWLSYEGLTIGTAMCVQLEDGVHYREIFHSGFGTKFFKKSELTEFIDMVLSPSERVKELEVKE